MPDNNSTELFIAIGRIEEAVKYMRESQERMEKKIDSQDARISEVELDVKELKTLRENKNSTIAVLIALASVAVAIVSLLFP